MLHVVVILVIMQYLVWGMRVIWKRWLQLKSWHKRKVYLYGRQKGGSMLMPSCMNIHNGNLIDSTAHSFFTGCSHMLWLPGGKNMIKPFAGASNSPFLSETLRWSLLPWSSLAQGQPEKGVYNDVYQLQRSPSKSPYDMETEESIHQEILNSIKECLQHRGVHAQLEERLKQSPTKASRPDPWTKFQVRVCTTYDHFMDLKEGSCEEALAVPQDAHQWALAALALLEEKIERLSYSVSCRWSGSHRCSGRCWCRSKAGSHMNKAPKQHHTKGSPPGGRPSPPAPCDEVAGDLLGQFRRGNQSWRTPSTSLGGWQSSRGTILLV